MKPKLVMIEFSDGTWYTFNIEFITSLKLVEEIYRSDIAKYQILEEKTIKEVFSKL
jgi:hypothetical protein